ncbi:MAG: hypothetical protein ABF649_01930 [Bacillus sp. (in: firmicutes)]
MAKSQAKKKREKHLREHGFDTTIRRGSWGSIHPATKKKKQNRSFSSKKKKNIEKTILIKHKRMVFLYQ